MNDTSAVPLPPALPGERRTTNRRSGLLSYYVDGEGPPMLLVHSINAAASAAEVGPLFEHYRRRARVYAVDLPGYGFSDRSARDYCVRLFVDAIHDMLDEISEASGETPVDAAALSLSSEFLARTATERPERFRTLTLVTPTGFTRRSDSLRAPEGTTREMGWLGALLVGKPWSRKLYEALVSRRSIRYFLKRTWGSEHIDEALAEYDWLTTHQPGAEHAPYAFLTGRLFSRDIRDVYERLELPVYLAHGTRGDFRDFSGAGWARAAENWTVESFDTGALVHFEAPEAFFASYERFLAEHR